MTDEDIQTDPAPSADGVQASDESAVAHESDPADDTTPHSRAEERSRRELARSERKIWIGVTIGAAIVLAIFLVLFWPIMAGRLDAAKQLDQARETLKPAVGTVADIDSKVQAQLGPAASDPPPDVSAELLVAKRTIKQSIALIDDAWPHLNEDEQKEAVLIRKAASTRLTMLEHAPAILTASAKAVRGKDLGDQGWERATSASKIETAALAALTAGSASDVRSAAVLAEREKGQLSDARDLFNRAVVAFPEAGFDRYVAYVTAKLSSASLLESAANAQAAGDSAGAARYRAQYAVQAAKVAVLGRALPYAPGSAAGAGFKQLVGRAVASYKQAKTEALKASQQLKDL